MDTPFADPSIGITELKKNPSAAVGNAGGAPEVIRYHRPLGYLVPARRDEAVTAVREDLALGEADVVTIGAFEDATRDRR